MQIRHRLQKALLALALVFVAAVAGHVYLGGASLLDAVYMVVISLTGVGYGEVVDTSRSPTLRAFNGVVLVVGVGVMIYVFSLATAFILEGELTQLVRRRRMQRRIATFSGHVIVCGVGETGAQVVRELGRSGGSVVAVDLRPEPLEALGDTPWLATITGDATDADVLDAAGLDRASGVVATLPTDKDNLVVTVTIRQKSPTLRIVARHVASAMGERIQRAGANATVSPTLIGGMRLASEMVRPQVVGFLDLMLREKSKTLRIEEIHVPAGSSWAGVNLAHADLRGRFGLVCLALRDQGEPSFRYNPTDTEVLRVGTAVIVLGEVKSVLEARAAASSH